ncbi:hypothetical protein FFK22_008945 [Mycobacterium sp. KBS0706]|uniref:hypothetical protein n=1 Tax=Mycobacterium sp. KBS0706 TaxID=2578109 RepID=UPI00110F8688|nr:hypothetical protein [Mycobacterium sp. KBS0706]TSD89096.1 hypothetical protein FFK22_008945 [Mycobacterium sp. KBS0706]
MSAATIATIADLERAFDGRIPAGLLELAKRAPQRVARICRTRVRAKLKAGAVRSAMVEAIVEIFEAQGGEVSEADLLSRGFTRKDLHDHGHAAKAAARPRLRRDRSAA